jgi:hypothetical protein
LLESKDYEGGSVSNLDLWRDSSYETTMMMNVAQAQGNMHPHHGQHQGHHITLETLHINPAALLYSPTGGMMRVSSGALAPSMLLPTQAGAMPPHSPTGTSMPLISSQLEGKSHKHSLSFDDTDSLSDNDGNSDSGEGPRKRGYRFLSCWLSTVSSALMTLCCVV